MKKTSTNRVNLFNINYKNKGGDILNGIKIKPDVNDDLKKLVSETGLSKTQIVNNSIEIYKKLYSLGYSKELFDILVSLHRRKKTSKKTFLEFLKDLDSEI